MIRKLEQFCAPDYGSHLAAYAACSDEKLWCVVRLQVFGQEWAVIEDVFELPNHNRVGYKLTRFKNRVLGSVFASQKIIHLLSGGEAQMKKDYFSEY